MDMPNLLDSEMTCQALVYLVLQHALGRGTPEFQRVVCVHGAQLELSL